MSFLIPIWIRIIKESMNIYSNLSLDICNKVIQIGIRYIKLKISLLKSILKLI